MMNKILQSLTVLGVSASLVTPSLTASATGNSLPQIKGVEGDVVEKGADYDSLKGIKAYDKEDGDLTDKIKVTGDVDTSKLGKYKVQYKVTDSDGAYRTKWHYVYVVKEGSLNGSKDNDTKDKNKDESKAEVASNKKTSTKDLDENMPLITVPTKDLVYQGDHFDPMKGVKAPDKKDGDITDKVTVKGDIDTSKTGLQYITYHVKDSDGYYYTYKRGVYVNDADLAPNPELSGIKDVTIKKGQDFDLLKGIKAKDKSGKDLTSDIVTSGEVDTSKPGKYKVGYAVSDADGHISAEGRTITVK